MLQRKVKKEMKKNRMFRLTNNSLLIRRKLGKEMKKWAVSHF